MFDGETMSSYLAAVEFNQLLVFPSHARQSGRRVVPPLLRQQERLINGVERK
jgi:hypothetical protein